MVDQDIHRQTIIRITLKLSKGIIFSRIYRIEITYFLLRYVDSMKHMENARQQDSERRRELILINAKCTSVYPRMIVSDV